MEIKEWQTIRCLKIKKSQNGRANNEAESTDDNN